MWPKTGIPRGVRRPQLLYCPAAGATVVIVDRTTSDGIDLAVYLRVDDGDYRRVFPTRPRSELVVRDMVQDPETTTIYLSTHRLADVKTAMNWDGIFALDCATQRIRRLVAASSVSFDRPGYGHVSTLVGVEPSKESLLVHVGFKPDRAAGGALPYWIARLRLRDARVELLQPLKQVHH